MAIAIRLLRRLLIHYRRAFDVVLGDSLYADSRFFNFLLGNQGKDLLVVFKDNRRDLMQDATGLLRSVKPTELMAGKTRREC